MTPRRSRRPRAGRRPSARWRPPGRTASSRTPGPPSLPGRRAAPGSRRGRRRASCPSSCAPATSTIGCRASWPSAAMRAGRAAGRWPGHALVPSAVAGRYARLRARPGGGPGPQGATCSRERRDAALRTGGWSWQTSATTGRRSSPGPASTPDGQPRGSSKGSSSTSPGERLVRVLEQVTAHAAPGSRLGFDIVNAAVLTSPYTRPWVEMQAAAGAPWLGTHGGPGRLPGRARLERCPDPGRSAGRQPRALDPAGGPDRRCLTSRTAGS